MPDIAQEVAGRAADFTIGAVVQKPQAELVVDNADSLISIVLTGLPPCTEAQFESSVIFRILHQYKRLLLSGIYGRTKKEHARLLKKAEKKAIDQYNRQLKAFLEACPASDRSAIARALHSKNEPSAKFYFREKGKPDKDDDLLRRYDTPQQPRFFLPEDSDFTLPMTYTISFSVDSETGLQKITIHIFNNMAFPALERMPNGDLRELSFPESFGKLTAYGKIIACDMCVFFDEVENNAKKHGIAPDYYGFFVK